MEEGCLTDSTGRKVSFKNAIVVMTSNVGGEQKSDGLGFRPAGRDGNTQKALQECFSPEFLGRLDGTICFETLSTAAMDAIAQKYLSQLKDRLVKVGVQLQFPEELAQSLSSRCGNNGGARALRRLIQQEVENPLATLLLKNTKKLSKIRATLKEGQLQFQS
jgi:ATP-dependent Clp protease ATP-binding subunit ClpC